MSSLKLVGECVTTNVITLKRMDGHCFSCTDKFGIFRREHGCKRCGFVFCSKCLNNSIVLPDHGTKEQNVCNKCYKQLTALPNESMDNERNEEWMAPPKNFKKRIAALAAKKQEATHPVATASSEGTRKRGLVSMSSEDRQIAERLERLKAARKKARGRTLSTEEIEDRLQKLKGYQMPSTSGTRQSVQPHQAPDQRTQYEKTNDLMKQMKEEASIDAKIKGTEVSDELQREELPGFPACSSEQELEQKIRKLMQDAQEELKQEEEGLTQEAEIAARLAKLNAGIKAYDDARGPDEGRVVVVDDIEEDKEAATNRLIKQLLEEDELEASMGASNSAQDCQPQPSVQKPSSGSYTPDPDELPWCCICNEDATLRCHGCDRDLYCTRCFREGHDGCDLKDHRTSNYKPPKAGRS